MTRSDKGGDNEAPFDEFCLEHGIIHQTTAPYSPQSNGNIKGYDECYVDKFWFTS